MTKAQQNTVQRLSNHQGRFLTITVNRAKSGPQKYSGKVKSVGASNLRFWDSNSGKVITAPLVNVTVG